MSGSVTGRMGRCSRVPTDVVRTGQAFTELTRSISGNLTAVTIEALAFGIMGPASFLSLTALSGHNKTPGLFSPIADIPLTIGDGAETSFIDSLTGMDGAIIATETPNTAMGTLVSFDNSSSRFLGSGNNPIGGSGGGGGGPKGPDNLKDTIIQSLAAPYDHPAQIEAVARIAFEWSQELMTPMSHNERMSLQLRLEGIASSVLYTMAREISGLAVGGSLLLHSMGVLRSGNFASRVERLFQQIPKARDLPKGRSKAEMETYLSNILHRFEVQHLEIFEEAPPQARVEQLVEKLLEKPAEWIIALSKIMVESFNHLGELLDLDKI